MGESERSGETRGCRAGTSLGRRVLISGAAIFALFLSTHSVSAQEVIDPRSGRLHLTVTDLVVPAGPIRLEISRTLEPQRTDRGLLGARWRLNWESRVVPRGQLMLLEEAPYPVAFTTSGTTPGYTSVTGDRLAIERDGRMVRTKLDGTRETFDVQGRLAERDYRNGNRATVRYGADGRIARIDGPRGSSIQFSADNQGRIMRIEASTGASARYAYTGDNLTEIQVNGGPIVRYAYDTSGALTRIDKPRSGGVELAYDARGRVLTRRWVDGSQERYEFDDPARRQRHIDPGGGITTIQWSQDKRTAEITNPLGHKSVIVFDAAGRPESITGPTGETAKTIYDSLGRPSAFHDPYGRVTHYEYLGATGRVRMIARPDGTQESLAYDPQQNVTEIKLGPQSLATLAYHPDGTVSAAKALGVAEQRLTYDGQGRLHTLTNPLGERLQFGYDARGNPVRVIDPLGGVWAWQWNAQDRLLSETDPAGGTTRYEYDSSDRLARVIDPLGGSARFEYDVRGRLVAETDPSGQETRYEYDRAGRLVKLSRGASSESFGYDAAGNLTERVDRLGRSVRLERNLLGRLTEERWSTGLQVRYRYDARGRVSAIEDSAGRKREWQHDGRGQIISQHDALGAITQFQYDALGNITARRDPRGHIKQFAYTADGALTRVQEPSGDAAEYRYDAAHRLVEMVRPSGGRSRFTYNGLGHLTQEVDPLGQVRRYDYDAAGRLVARTDATGRTTRYTYDAAGRLTEKRLADGKRVTFKYNGVGKLLEADDGAFPLRYQYDRAGRVVRVEYPAVKKAVAYQYEATGLRTRLILPDARVTQYEYDAHKQLAAIVPPDGKRIVLAYDAQRRLQAIVYPSGITGRWEYDATGRVTKLEYVDASGKGIGAWMYRYDPDGNLLDQQAQGRRTTYAYDGSGQLIEAAAPAGVVRYGYGRGGGRVAMEAGASVTRYRHDGADRLVEAGVEKLTYDANGNLVRREGPTGTTSYEYDAEERLVRVHGADGKSTAFGYGPTGERVWKRDAAGITYYLYDGLDVVQELDEKGSPKAAYAHGPGIDQPLAMLREGKSYYYHADRLGSIRLVTNERGEVAAAYDYDAYGNMEGTTRTAVPNPFTFTGREWDASAGLYYYRTRYYDPALGQFLSPDRRPAALDEPLEHNPYLYVRNRPLRFVDPLGLAENNPYQEASTDELVQRKAILDGKAQRVGAAQSTLLDRPNEIFGNTTRNDPGPMRGLEGTWNRARYDRLDRMRARIDAARQPIAAELTSRGYTPPLEPEISPAEEEWVNNWVKNRLNPALAEDAAIAARAAQDAEALAAQAATKAELAASGRGRNPTGQVAVDGGGTASPATGRVPRPPVVPEAAVVEAEAGAALAATEGGALARLKGALPGKGTLVAVAAVPAVLAVNEAIQAEPGKELEAAAESLGESGRGLLEFGGKTAGCAVGGALVGGCLGGPPGALVGAKIGAAVPAVVDTIKSVAALPPAISDLKENLEKGDGLSRGPFPAGGLGPGKPTGEEPLAGPVTGGLPGAPPPPWTLGGDPNRSQGGAGPTPEQIADAGRQGFEGVPGVGGPAGGKRGGEKTGDRNVGPQDPTYLAPGSVPVGQPGQGVQVPPGPVVPGDTGPQFPLRPRLPGPTTDRPAGPLAGPVTGGLPGAPPPPPGAGGSTPGPPPGPTARALPTPGQPPPQTPGSGGQEVDLSGVWYATYLDKILGNFRFTLTLSRVKAGQWQGPLDYANVGCPELSFNTPANLQVTGVGEVLLTYNSQARECRTSIGRLAAGAVEAKGKYTKSQITFGDSPNTVTYTRNRPW